MGNILFKMLTGKVPFKGTNPIQVYSDIKNRNIQWPREDLLKEVMSEEAKDLIDKMLQLKPADRLGCNPESMKALKAHPFFKEVDFAEVSSRSFTGAADKVLAIKEKIEKQKIMRSQIVQAATAKSFENLDLGAGAPKVS